MKSKLTISSNDCGCFRLTTGDANWFSWTCFLLLGCCLLLFCPVPTAACETLYQEIADKKKEAEKEGQTENKNKQQAEIDRRLESLSKSIEKEDRPDRPSFVGSKTAGRNGAITFDDLKFEMDKRSKFKREMLTNSINDLVGERLRLKGYIRPSIRQKGLTKFIFVRDNKECCFGPGAALYDCVLVTLANGKKSDYVNRPLTVEGDFFLKEYTGPDGRVWAVYRMKNGEIK